MKRFYRIVAVAEAPGGWQVTLDGRGVRTQGGRAQIVPARALADALAEEWAGQGATIAAAGFALRDLADFALDAVAPDRAATHAALIAYGETDTLLYRAEPDEALGRRQRALWEPLVQAAEARLTAHFVRVAGVIHRAQPAATLARLREDLAGRDDFTLAALRTLAGLAASLLVALAALEPDAEPAALFAAANLEEDWQTELWGADGEAQARRAARLAAFMAAARFAALARGARAVCGISDPP